MNPKHTFKNLNGLRFIGALSVFIFHIFTLNREIWGDFFQNYAFKVVYQLASRGHFGVGLFFVLSGFLITNLMLTELRFTNTLNIKNFFFRRILRIWPIYFLLLIFGFFIFPFLPFGIETIHSLGFYTIFLSNLDEIWVGASDSLTFLTVTWSVSIEEQFYLSLFFVLAIFPKLRNSKTLLFYFLAVVLINVIFRSFHYLDERVLYFHSLSVMSDLAIGGLIAFWVSRNTPVFIINLTRFQLIIIYLLGILMLIFSRQIFHGYLIAVERIFQSLFFAFVLLEQLFSKNSWFQADKIPGFFFAGNLTYAFYMFHCVFIYFWGFFFKNQGWTDSMFWFLIYMIFNFCSTFVFSILSYYFFEKPFLNLKRHFR